ncbi:sensor histidine kinase [Microbulbifer aggregans]|uniref:sensor histidine kinase n=1 Tax=Microbulbifer aggregans TaxID=1769779 RepID=UPI001CFC6944|nr:hypothetical protein [Microbulbifer aggregans]
MKTEHPQGNLQRRVFVVFGSFTLALCLIYSAIGVLVAYGIEDRLLENLVNNEADYIERSLQESGEFPPPRLPEFSLYTSASETPPEFLTALEGEKRKAELFVAGRQHYHLRQLAPEAGAILAADVGELLTVSRQSSHLIWLIVFALLCTTLLALWLAHRLVAATIRPVLELARELESQPENMQPVALSNSHRKDEIGFLARTLQRNINGLRQAQQREAEFTRDVSHELRTGLAIATNTLTLARGRNLERRETRELESILASMNTTIGTLLALARAESFEHTTFNLRSLLEERLLARPEISTGKSFRLKLALPEALAATGNAQLTALLLDILLDNVIRHAAQPTLHIYKTGNALVFENPTERLLDTATIFNRGTHRTDSQGLGQGLYLAGRILNAQDWQYRATCTSQLFTFSIDLT